MVEGVMNGMNTQSIEENRQGVTYGREEYVRKARESCLMNYYGDKMQSRDKILKEIALKKKEEEERIKELQQSGNRNPVVIPFEEGKLQRENRNQQNAALLREDSDWRNQNTEKIDADAINRKLSSNSFVDLSADTTRLPDLGMFLQEPKDELIPESSDILKMSGIEETLDTRIQNDYVNEFTNTYHNAEPTNFLTSIRNAELEKEENKLKDHAEVKSFRVFVIRCVCAFLLLVTIIVLDNMKFSYKGHDAKSIYNKIVSTELMERVESYFATSSSE